MYRIQDPNYRFQLAVELERFYIQTRWQSLHAAAVWSDRIPQHSGWLSYTMHFPPYFSYNVCISLIQVGSLIEEPLVFCSVPRWSYQNVEINVIKRGWTMSLCVSSFCTSRQTFVPEWTYTLHGKFLSLKCTVCCFIRIADCVVCLVLFRCVAKGATYQGFATNRGIKRYFHRAFNSVSRVITNK
jgi:hypothetical protein